MKTPEKDPAELFLEKWGIEKENHRAASERADSQRRQKEGWMTLACMLLLMILMLMPLHCQNQRDQAQTIRAYQSILDEGRAELKKVRRQVSGDLERRLDEVDRILNVETYDDVRDD